MPTKVWAEGEEVIAGDFNTMVQEQVIPTFANAAARDTAITAPRIGQHCFLNDLRMLLQYTDRSGTPGWHRPWSEPWGFISNVAVPDFTFGSGWTFMPSSGWNCPTPGRAVRVTFGCNVVKLVDGSDAFIAVRLQAAGGVLRDSYVTLHQGWAAFIQVSEVVPSDAGGNSNGAIAVISTTNQAVTQWARLTVEDLGPATASAQP
jgi:hypothetical protein